MQSQLGVSGTSLYYLFVALFCALGQCIKFNTVLKSCMASVDRQRMKQEERQYRDTEAAKQPYERCSQRNSCRNCYNRIEILLIAVGQAGKCFPGTGLHDVHALAHEAYED